MAFDFPLSLPTITWPDHPTASSALPRLQSATVNHPHIVVQFLLNSTLDNAIALLQTGASHPPELGLLPLEVSPFPV